MNSILAAQKEKCNRTRMHYSVFDILQQLGEVLCLHAQSVLANWLLITIWMKLDAQGICLYGQSVHISQMPMNCKDYLGAIQHQKILKIGKYNTQSCNLSLIPPLKVQLHQLKNLWSKMFLKVRILEVILILIFNTERTGFLYCKL